MLPIITAEVSTTTGPCTSISPLIAPAMTADEEVTLPIITEPSPIFTVPVLTTSPSTFAASAKNSEDEVRRVRKNASQFNIERQLVDVFNFMNSDSYYLKDIRANMKSIREELSEKGEIFNFKTQQEFNNFYKILHSNEFGRAQKGGILDSSIEMDEIKESLLKGATVDEILGALQDFATSELTIDEFQRLVDEQRTI